MNKSYFIIRRENIMGVPVKVYFEGLLDVDGRMLSVFSNDRSDARKLTEFEAQKLTGIINNAEIIDVDDDAKESLRIKQEAYN